MGRIVVILLALVAVVGCADEAPDAMAITVADADRLRMVLGEQPLATRALGANDFRANCVASNNALYWVTPSSDLAMGDSLRHRLRVIPDIKPAIKVEEVVDSTSRKLRHFSRSPALLRRLELCFGKGIKNSSTRNA